MCHVSREDREISRARKIFLQSARVRFKIIEKREENDDAPLSVAFLNDRIYYATTLS